MKTLAVLLLLFVACSLAHFVHNAEFVADYPNMPAGMAAALVLVEVARQLVRRRA